MNRAFVSHGCSCPSSFTAVNENAARYQSINQSITFPVLGTHQGGHMQLDMQLSTQLGIKLGNLHSEQIMKSGRLNCCRRHCLCPSRHAAAGEAATQHVLSQPSQYPSSDEEGLNKGGAAGFCSHNAEAGGPVYVRRDEDEHYDTLACTLIWLVLGSATLCDRTAEWMLSRQHACRSKFS